MELLTLLKNFLVAKLLTLYYSLQILFLFAFNYVKNPFADPFVLKLRLEPPPPLTDPKYGVHKYIKVNNTKLHYVESGDPSKPLMIFVHGFPEFWYSWRHQIVEFNKDYWCIAVDMRGNGDSERPDGVSSYKIELLVEDLRDLVRKLGREKCILVAHDWGGLIACKFRDIHYDALDAIIVLASASIESCYHQLCNNPEQRKMSWYVFFYQMPCLPERLIQMNNLELFEKIMLNPKKDTVTEKDLECYKYWFGKSHALTPAINYYRANFVYTMPEKKRCERNIPFLAAHAARDAYLSHSLLDVMKEEYAHIETAIVEDCRHFLIQEEPAKVNKLIKDFLSKHNI